MDFVTTNICICLYSGTPIYNLFPASTIPVQHDKLIRLAPRPPKWHATNQHVRKRGRKRRAGHDQCDLPHHDTLPDKSPVLKDSPDTSSNRDSVPAPKRAKIDTQPTEIMSSHELSNTDVERSHIAKISSSCEDEIMASRTTDQGEIPVSHTTDHGEIPACHATDQGEIRASATDHGETPASHTTDQGKIPVLHVTDVEGVSNLHILSITDRADHSSVVLGTSTSENEPGSVHHTNEATTDVEHQYVIPSENVLPVPGESSLFTRKRPRRQLEEIFEAAVLTKPKRRKRLQRWREGKGGSGWRRWQRWKKEENRKKRWRQKQHGKKRSKSTTPFKTDLPGKVCLF